MAAPNCSTTKAVPEMPVSILESRQIAGGQSMIGDMLGIANYLYIAETTDGRFCKIGRTMSPAQRLSTMHGQSKKVGGCGRMRFIAVWLADSQIYYSPELYRQETEITQRFIQYNVLGEWFNTSEEIRKFARESDMFASSYKVRQQTPTKCKMCGELLTSKRGAWVHCKPRKCRGCGICPKCQRWEKRHPLPPVATLPLR